MFGFNELSTPIKAIIALGLVLLLVVIAGLLLRRISGGRLKLPGQGARARQPRLGIVDIFEMDRQRQLVLLRRDNVEHLVMIGGPNDLVVEASIVRSGARAQVPVVSEANDKGASSPAAEMRAELPAETVPVQRPIPAAVTPEPVAPQPKPAVAASTVSVAPTAATGLAAGAATGAAALAAAVMPAGAMTAPSSPEPVKPPVPQPPAPEAPVMPSPAQVAVASTPAASTQPAPTLDDQIAASFEAELAKMAPSPATPPAKPILESIAPPPLAKASASELDDMTRQLQEALKRPFSGVKAPSAVPPEVIPAPRPTEARASIPPEESIKPVLPLPPRAEKPENRTPDIVPAAEVSPPPKPVSNFDFDLERELASALEPVPVPDMIPPLATAVPAVPPLVRSAAPVAEEVIAAKIEPPAKIETPAKTLLEASPPDEAKVTTKPTISEDVAVAADEPAPPAKASGKPAPKAEAKIPNAESQPEAAKIGASKTDANALDPFSVDAIEAEFARLLNRSAPPKT